MVLLIGFALLALLGTVHFHGQRAIRALVNRSDGAAPSSPLVAFLSLAVLHLVEIGAFATGFRAASVTFWAGDFGAGFTAWEDFLYLSLIAFTTLGFAELDVTGDARILLGMEALGGFMVLTWSATFLYETSQSALSR